MAVNTQKVVVAGLASGVVQAVLSGVGFSMLLGPRMNAEMDSKVAGMSAMMASGANMGIQIGSSFVVGLLLAWLYAGMRPRYGAGAGTAMRAGFAVWLCGVLFYMHDAQGGMISWTSYVMASCLMLVVTGAGALTAGALYKEEGA